MKKKKKKPRAKKGAPKQVVKKSDIIPSSETAIDRLSLVNNQAFVFASQINTSILGNAFMPLSESIQRMNNQFVGISGVLNQFQSSNVFSQLTEASSSIHAARGVFRFLCQSDISKHGFYEE